jgi:hypothetical protein
VISRQKSRDKSQRRKTTKAQRHQEEGRGL